MKTTNACRVTLIDSMGTDLTVVNAARVSLDKTSDWEGVGGLATKDARLIHYLAKHQHWTPFAHVMVTLRLTMPVFVARQWFRHTVGAARNEVSRRYVDDAPEYFVPDDFRCRPEGSIKQGSGGRHYMSDTYRTQVLDLYDQVETLYSDMILGGVAPEQARMILPLAHMTEFYETASLAFYARCAALRLDSHAQGEIRDLMQLIANVVQPVAPTSWEALVAGED